MKNIGENIRALPLIAGTVEEKAVEEIEEKADSFGLSRAAGDADERRMLLDLFALLQGRCPFLFTADGALLPGEITPRQCKKLKKSLKNVGNALRIPASVRSAKMILPALRDARERLAVLEKAAKAREDAAARILASFPAPAAARLAAFLRDGDASELWMEVSFLTDGGEKGGVIFNFPGESLCEELVFSGAYFLVQKGDAPRLSAALKIPVDVDMEICGIGQNGDGDWALCLLFPGTGKEPSFSALLCFRTLAYRAARKSLLRGPDKCIADTYAALLRLAVSSPESLSEDEKALLPIAHAMERVMTLPPAPPDGAQIDAASTNPEEAARRLCSLLPEDKPTSALHAHLTALFTLAPAAPEEASHYFAGLLRSPEGEGLDAALREKLAACEKEFPDRFPVEGELRQVEKTVSALAEAVLAEKGFSGAFPHFKKEEETVTRFLSIYFTLSHDMEEDESHRRCLFTFTLRGGILSQTSVDALEKAGVTPDLAACYRKGDGRKKFKFRESRLSFLPEGEDGIPEREKETLRCIFAGAGDRVKESRCAREEKKASRMDAAGTLGGYLLSAGVILLFLWFCAAILGIIFTLFGGLLTLILLIVTGRPFSEMFREFPLGELFGYPFVLLPLFAGICAVWNSVFPRVKRLRFARWMRKMRRRRQG